MGGRWERRRRRSREGPCEPKDLTGPTAEDGLWQARWHHLDRGVTLVSRCKAAGFVVEMEIVEGPDLDAVFLTHAENAGAVGRTRADEGGVQTLFTLKEPTERGGPRDRGTTSSIGTIPLLPHLIRKDQRFELGVVERHIVLQGGGEQIFGNVVGFKVRHPAVLTEDVGGAEFEVGGAGIAGHRPVPETSGGFGRT